MKDRFSLAANRLLGLVREMQQKRVEREHKHLMTIDYSKYVFVIALRCLIHGNRDKTPDFVSPVLLGVLEFHRHLIARDETLDSLMALKR